MRDTLSKIIIFAAGVAVGSLVTKKLIERRYERSRYDGPNQSDRENEEELIGESIYMDDADSDDDISKKVDASTVKEYAARLQKHGYTDYSNLGAIEEEDDMDYEDDLSIIAPEELGECDDYEVIELTYYSDDILADDMDEIVENAEKIVGHDYMNHFGDYEEDSVCIRNDRLKCDYQILLDPRKYSDVTGKPRPNKTEG